MNALLRVLDNIGLMEQRSHQVLEAITKVWKRNAKNGRDAKRLRVEKQVMAARAVARAKNAMARVKLVETKEIKKQSSMFKQRSFPHKKPITAYSMRSICSKAIKPAKQA